MMQISAVNDIGEGARSQIYSFRAAVEPSEIYFGTPESRQTQEQTPVDPYDRDWNSLSTTQASLWSAITMQPGSLLNSQPQAPDPQPCSAHWGPDRLRRQVLKEKKDT